MAITLSPDERRLAVVLDDITDIRKEICRLEAGYLRKVAELSRVGGSTRSVINELALALRLGKDQAGKEIAHAQALTRLLPRTLAALEDGVIDRYKAGKVVDGFAVLDDEQTRRADEILATRLEKTSDNLSRAIARVVNNVDPDGYQARCKQRRRDRKVTLTPQDHGMSSLTAELPAEVASAVYGSLTDAARALRKIDKTRTTDQLRADILAERLLAGNGGSLKTHVYVYVDLFSLLRVNNNLAYLPGYGDIPVEVVRERIFDPNSTWSRLITDPDTGQLMSVGRTKYRPPADLDDYVRIRARTCSHPGCNQPAQFVDVDHTQDWAKGGETSANNLDGRCRYHHLLKNEPGWTYTTGPDGITTITTPAGRTYTSTPEPIHEPRQPEEPPPF